MSKHVGIKSCKLPRCVNRFLATVRSDWHWFLSLLSSSQERAFSRTPRVTLQGKNKKKFFIGFDS